VKQREIAERNSEENKLRVNYKRGFLRLYFVGVVIYLAWIALAAKTQYENITSSDVNTLTTRDAVFWFVVAYIVYALVPIISVYLAGFVLLPWILRGFNRKGG
jgi:hypothetical protein